MSKIVFFSFIKKKWTRGNIKIVVEGFRNFGSGDGAVTLCIKTINTNAIRVMLPKL